MQELYFISSCIFLYDEWNNILINEKSSGNFKLNISFLLISWILILFLQFISNIPFEIFKSNKCSISLFCCLINVLNMILYAFPKLSFSSIKKSHRKLLLSNFSHLIFSISKLLKILIKLSINSLFLE